MTNSSYRFILMGTAIGHPDITGIYTKRDTFCSFVWGDKMPWAKKWKTIAGVRRHIEKEQAAGARWSFSIISIREEDK